MHKGSPPNTHSLSSDNRHEPNLPPENQILACSQPPAPWAEWDGAVRPVQPAPLSHGHSGRSGTLKGSCQHSESDLGLLLEPSENKSFSSGFASREHIKAAPTRGIKTCRFYLR